MFEPPRCDTFRCQRAATRVTLYGWFCTLCHHSHLRKDKAA